MGVNCTVVESCIEGSPQRKLTRRNWSWDSTDENKEGIFLSDYVATNSYGYEKSETATFQHARKSLKHTFSVDQTRCPDLA